MLNLRTISAEDMDVLSSKAHLSNADLISMIDDTNAKSFNHRYFEMYVITEDDLIVGLISLYEQSASVISIGPEIFNEYRNCGYATNAMKIALEIARSNGYKIVFQQIRADNTASIRLHEKLGFETDGIIYKNRKQNDVYIYLKSI